MNKCLKIIFSMKPTDKLLKDIIQKNARKFNLEGLAQVLGVESIKIIVCGQKDDVDSFVDSIHKEITFLNSDKFEIEAFLKDRDYRGVFRIIE